jgi:hypothetical protein
METRTVGTRHGAAVRKVVGLAADTVVSFGKEVALNARRGAGYFVRRLRAGAPPPKRALAAACDARDGVRHLPGRMSIGRQVFIPNVRRNAMFMGTDAGKALEKAGCAAVTSSPLVHDSGLVVGMISTHYRKPCAEHQAGLASLDLVARCAAAWLDVLTASG